MPKRFQAGTFCQFWFWTWWIALPLQLRPLKCHHFAEGQPGSTAGGRKVWGLVLRSKVTFNAVPPSNMASAGAQLGTQRRSPHARQVSVRCLELREFLDRIWYALLYVALIISHHPSHSKLSDPPRRPFTIAATAAVGRSSATSARSNSSGPTRCSPAAAAPAVTAGATGQTRSAAAAPTSPWAWRTPPQRWRKGNGACPERWDMRLGHPWTSGNQAPLRGCYVPCERAFVTQLQVVDATRERPDRVGWVFLHLSLKWNVVTQVLILTFCGEYEGVPEFNEDILRCILSFLTVRVVPRLKPSI